MHYAILEDRKVVLTDDSAKAFSDPYPVKVGDDYLGEVHVSTVFLRMNHGFTPDRPLWFETMIFGGPHDQWQDRYETFDEAEAGHQRVVAALRAGESPDNGGTGS